MSVSKPTNNTELVRNLMEFSPHGALSQVFIIEAIRRYADTCAKLAPQDMDNPMISGAAWKGVAVDIKTRMDAFYNRNSPKPAKRKGALLVAGDDGPECPVCCRQFDQHSSVGEQCPDDNCPSYDEEG